LAALAVVLALGGGGLLALFLSNGPSESTVITEPTTMSTFLADVISPENVSQLYEWRAYESQDFVESVAFSPDNTVLAWGGEGGIWLYNLVDDRELCHLTGHTGQVHSVVFSTDGTRLFSGGVDTGGGKVRVWDWSTCTELWSLSVAPEEWGVWVDLSADGKYLASSGGLEVVLWRVSESGLEWQKTLSVSGGVPTFSPDGTLVAFWETDGGVRVVNIEDGGSYFFEAPSDPEYGPHLAFSPDSSMIAGGAYDGDVRVWRIADGELVYRLKAHDTPVESVAFSPDGQLLASGARDGSICLWQMVDAYYIWDVLNGRARVFFSPDGRILASGSADSTVRLWGVH
jgi:WD40 repeat protein